MHEDQLADDHGRRVSAGSICLTAGALLVTACSTAPPISSEHGSSHVPAPSVSAGASVAHPGEMRALTALAVVHELTRAGFPAANPLDTTAQDCPAIGCTQSIVTDTLRVKSFPTTAQAQRYAVPRALYQVETVVVAFAPPLSERERARYQAEIQKLMD